MTDISYPPFKDMPPLSNLEAKDARFTPLWEQWFSQARAKVNENTSGLAEHIADTDNPHETSDANIDVTDITTNNVSTSAHGFAPKLPDDATKFFDGTGEYDTVKDTDLSLSNVTTNNVSITKHGFAPLAPNDTTKFLRGDATWAVPSAGIFGGTFTINNASFVTVNDANVTASCRIVCWPTNVAAGQLEAGASKLYTSTKTAGASFVQSTADAGNAPASDHTYDYIIFSG